MKQFSRNSAIAPLQLSLKSPPDYLQAISKVNPAWGIILERVERLSSLEACALWAGAVAVANGCRISEVLRLKICHLQPNGQAWTPGSKGSCARLLFLGLSLEQVREFYSLPRKLDLFPVPYISVWRACIKHGFADRLPGHKHLAVTHAGRYKLAQAIALEASEEVAGEVIGHRSKNSIQYYVHPQGFKMIVSKKQAKDKLQEAYNLLDLEIQKHLNKETQNEK